MFEELRLRQVHFLWPMVLLVALSIADLITTSGAIGAGATEANPLVAPWVDEWWAQAAKLALVGFIVVTTAYTRRLTVRLFALAWLAVGVYTSAVVINAMIWSGLAAA